MLKQVLLTVLWLLGVIFIPLFFFCAFEVITAIPIHVDWASIFIFWAVFAGLKLTLKHY